MGVFSGVSVGVGVGVGVSVEVSVAVTVGVGVGVSTTTSVDRAPLPPTYSLLTATGVRTEALSDTLKRSEIEPQCPPLTPVPSALFGFGHAL